MKKCLCLCLIALSCSVQASELYVNVNSTNPVPPFSGWSTAATNIQDAIDAASDGDLIWVTNGVYDSGGKAIAGDFTTNRLALDKAIAVRSVNGPGVTFLEGAGPIGNPGIRCAWLTNGASLDGFTLENGATRPGGGGNDIRGGGIWCASSNSLIENCIVRSCQANYGGGVFQGTLEGCVLAGNAAGGQGGGASDSTLINCTVEGNSGGGVYASNPGFVRLTNSIIYFNTAPDGHGVLNYANVTNASYCCTYPMPPASYGPGNITNAPSFAADNIHLTSDSPCRGAGTNVVSGVDIDGESWSNPPSIGCDEWTAAPTIASPPAPNAGGFGSLTLGALVVGESPFSISWMKDGVALSDDSHFAFGSGPTLQIKNFGRADAGIYQMIASNEFGAATSSVARVTVHCVSANGTSPASPYSDWATAATNIQDAIDAAAAGDVVLVTNGVYASGGKVMSGDLTNRVVLDKPLIVQSVNGPIATKIQGTGPAGPAAVRGAWLTNDAALVGFTIENGATRTSGSDPFTLETGGGVWCASSNVVVNDCIIQSNQAPSHAAGAYLGNLNGSAVLNNSGEGAYASILNNCTVVSNATYGATQCALTNCIVYYNHDSAGNSRFTFCCTTPPQSGAGNFVSPPELLADGFHLSADSPCLGAGTNTATGADIDGQPWANPPSIGCDQWEASPLITAQPQIEINPAAHALVLNIEAQGGNPMEFLWNKDGVPVLNDARHVVSDTGMLSIEGFDLADAGAYRVVISNAFGSVTSEVARVVIHAVDAASTNPAAPYSTWATAAANIQDAINVAGSGDIVLVTNGVYSTGGEVVSGDLTNRVVVDKPIIVTSVNGFASTVIRGARDPVATNGPAAVRCAWLTNSAVLGGFTLDGGATESSGDTVALQSGGGAWCASTNAILVNCEISSNNAAYSGGGVYSGTVNSSYLTENTASFGGGGAAYSILNNCTVVENYTFGNTESGGTYDASFRNSIVLNNYYVAFGAPTVTANCYPLGSVEGYAYSVTTPVPPGTGNFNVNPQFIGSYHLAASSPCRGAGSSLYSSGVDLDGEPWANPPSIGCDEIVESNLVGPLTVTIFAATTNSLVSHPLPFNGSIAGRASAVAWSFGDGTTVTNLSGAVHTWNAAGDYPVTFTAFNLDHPEGVATNLVVHIAQLNPPLLGSTFVFSNGIQFQFPVQPDGQYTIQYTTNLSPPVIWNTLQAFWGTGGVWQVTDTNIADTARFYRVLEQ